MKNIKSLILETMNDNSGIFPRLVVGLVFFSEGIQKFLFPELPGTERFEIIGFADPAFRAYFTGTFEIICSLLFLPGLFTRLDSLLLFIIMMTAFVTTKWPIFMSKGFCAMAHEYRTDFVMTFLLVYLFI